MQKYINQLLQDLKQAENNPVETKNHLADNDDIIEHMRQIEEAEYEPAENTVGVSYLELPPAGRLNKNQLQQLTNAIINALSAKGTEIAFPGNNIPVELAYSQLREHFKEGFYSMPGWTIDFCSGCCPDCAFNKYCDACDNEWVKEEMKNQDNR